MSGSSNDITPAGHQLRQRLLRRLQRYEVGLGPVPEWMNELEPGDALCLIETACRIGLRLPDTDLLVDEDRQRRAASLKPLRRRGAGGPT